MGNRTSRNASQKKQHHSLDNNSDQERTNKLHMDSHNTAMDSVLYHHSMLVPPNTDAQQLALNIHQNALNIAMEHHLNAAYANGPNCQQGRQMIYTL
jgi:hypothetical protein